MEIFNLFKILLYVDPTKSYLNLKIGLPPVPKAGSSATLFDQKTLFKAKLIDRKALIKSSKLFRVLECKHFG